MPLATSMPAASGELDVGFHADRDHHDRRRPRTPVGGAYDGLVPFVLDRRHEHAGVQVGALALVQLDVQLTELGREQPRQRQRGGLQQRDLAAEAAGARGDLGADQPGADDDQVAAGASARPGGGGRRRARAAYGRRRDQG